MKIFTDPQVFLVAYPVLNYGEIRSFFDEMEYEKKPGQVDWEDGGEDVMLTAQSKQADSLCEFAGRICYGSFGAKQGRRSNKDYLSHIIESGHGSVLEHANFTFLVIKASRGYTHEMVRHRAGFAYSQESTHFIDYSPEKARVCVDVNSVYVDEVPKLLEAQFDGAFETYKEVYDKLKRQYTKKQACSMARQILPIGIEAKLVFTGNIRAIRHFLVARGNSHNVMEIRKVAIQVYEHLKMMAPNSMHGLSLVDAEDGYLEIKAENFARKV